jgi:hypothetical protein
MLESGGWLDQPRPWCDDMLRCLALLDAALREGDDGA